MKKRKMSYRTARLVLESAEVQVPVEVDQQYNIVTAMDGIELNPGTMVNVTKVTDKQIEFKVVDTESIYSTDYDTFVTHCQLQSNNVNEGYVDNLSPEKLEAVAREIGLYVHNDIYEKTSVEQMRKDLSAELDAGKDKYQDLIARIVRECDESWPQASHPKKIWDSATIEQRKEYNKVSNAGIIDVNTSWDKLHIKQQRALQPYFNMLVLKGEIKDEALSPADSTRLTTIISNTYAMVNYAHVLHNNDFDAPNVNAVHLALETLYTELPALADELGEACRFDYDITLDSSVVINEANPVKACFDLRNDLLSLQKDMPGYINSMIDAINGLLTSVMYKMVRLGGLQKPAIAIVNEAEARGWSEYSVQEKLNALKLAIMSDGLAYNVEDYVGKDLKDMPKELQAALEVVTAVNESLEAPKSWKGSSAEERLNDLVIVINKKNLPYVAKEWAHRNFKDMPQDLQQAIVDVIKCDESEAQDAYREFFRAKLEEFGAKSPAELSEQQKKDFFNQIKAEWPDAKAEMLNESKESDEANKVAFARAYADCNDIKKVQKIDEILLKAGQRVSTSIDVAFAAVKPEIQKQLCNTLGIDWMNESKSNVNLNRKRSIIAALKYVNEELEVGAELKCLKDLVTTDGTVIPAESTVSYTGIDSNTNVATVTFGENSYAVTIPDLTAATQQMRPAI